jgi:hypothetical protein
VGTEFLPGTVSRDYFKKPWSMICLWSRMLEVKFLRLGQKASPGFHHTCESGKEDHAI